MARGRKPAHGVKKTHILFRLLWILYAYDKARSAGMGYTKALAAAEAFIRDVFPGMPISETEVKRIVALGRPRGAAEVWLVKESGNGSYTIGVGPGPKYSQRPKRWSKFVFSEAYNR